MHYKISKGEGGELYCSCDHFKIDEMMQYKILKFPRLIISVFFKFSASTNIENGHKWSKKSNWKVKQCEHFFDNRTIYLHNAISLINMDKARQITCSFAGRNKILSQSNKCDIYQTSNLIFIILSVDKAYHTISYKPQQGA